MKKLNLTKRLYATFSFMALMLLATGGISYAIAQSFSLQTNVATVLNQTEKSYLGIKSNVFLALFFKGENNNLALETVSKSHQTLSSELKKYAESLKQSQLSPPAKSLSVEIIALVDQYIAESTGIVTKLSDDKIAEARVSIDSFEKTFNLLEEKMGIFRIQSEKEVPHSILNDPRALDFIGLLTGLGFFAFCVMGIYTIRTIKFDLKIFFQSLRNSGDQVNALANEMSSSNVQLSSNATETASSLEESVASLEELSSMIILNTENSKKVFSVSEVTTQVAEAGEKNIQSLNLAMNEIKLDSKKMEEIVNVIDDISFQTNLLALNAAVEAARAGEQGKGFAVVADAVRSLAQRSSTSAKEINVMIKDNLEKVDKGSLLASECNKSLKQIFEQVKQVTALSGQIASASQEQTLGLKQINQAMVQLDSASQDNASAAENVSKTSSATQDQAGKMLNVVSKMEQFIFGFVERSEVVNNPMTKSIQKKVEAQVPTKKLSQMTISKVPVKKAEIINFKQKKTSLNMGQEPKDNKIKKIENF